MYIINQFNKKQNLFFIFFILLLINNNVFAWNHTGHELISQIAYQDLPKNQQEKLDGILNSLIANLDSEDKKVFKQQVYSLSNLAKLSILPDYWKDYSLTELKEKLSITDNAITVEIDNDNTSKWHYSNRLIPVADNNKNTSNNKFNNKSIGTLDNNLKQIITNTKKTRNPEAQALGIIYITHLLEDAHQPLHVISMPIDHNLSHDQGGNKFCLSVKNKINHICNYNLHAYWDSAGRLLTGNKNSKLFSSLAAEITAIYPKDYFKNQNKNLNPDSWLEESFNFWPSVYNTKQNTKPSKIYQAKVRDIASQRIALAGYRLSKLLQEIL